MRSALYAPPAEETAQLSFERSQPGQLQVRLHGSWELQRQSPELHTGNLQKHLEGVERLSFNTDTLQNWDSQLLVFLRKLLSEAEARGIDVELKGLPAGMLKLLSLASTAPESTNVPAKPVSSGPIGQLGTVVLGMWLDLRGSLHFIGESAIAMARVVRGQSSFNFADLWPLMQDCGPKALPIVTLVSFLVGTILAYMGAVQLQQFGAQIFIADLVALGMAREMGAIMTGVVIAGRSGAAFAAQLGTMKVNEEIDALATLGISPIDYLVLPRLLALILMVPLLTLYADLMGILGGMVVAVSLMDLHIVQYLNQSLEAVTLADFAAGLIKATAYGTLVAIAGCMRGMQCGGSAEAVGLATTSAVVTSIVYMVIAAALLAVVFHEIGL